MKGYHKRFIPPSAAELAAGRKRRAAEHQSILALLAQMNNATQPAPGPDVTGSVSIETATDAMQP